MHAGLIGFACLALAGCAVPAYQFPGGPSPWLPQGAPSSLYGPSPATTVAPAKATQSPAVRAADWRMPRTSVRYAFTSSRGDKGNMIDSVLVVCTGNICRSPMAAALLAERAKDRGAALEIGSAGVAALAGHPSPEPVINLMKERGIDVSGHRARQLSGALGMRHELILVMERMQREFIMRKWPELTGRVQLFGERREEDVYDPYGFAPAAYAQCLAQIEACLGDWDERLFS